MQASGWASGWGSGWAKEACGGDASEGDAMQAVGVRERIRELGAGLGSRSRADGADGADGRSRGLVWPLLERLGVLCKTRSAAQLTVLETLSLGGRRQLFLIACGGERYLVGAGAEGVGTMLRVGSVPTADESA
jgi:hypothetical protein